MGLGPQVGGHPPSAPAQAQAPALGSDSSSPRCKPAALSPSHRPPHRLQGAGGGNWGIVRPRPPLPTLAHPANTHLPHTQPGWHWAWSSWPRIGRWRRGGSLARKRWSGRPCHMPSLSGIERGPPPAPPGSEAAGSGRGRGRSGPAAQEALGGGRRLDPPKSSRGFGVRLMRRLRILVGEC